MDIKNVTQFANFATTMGLASLDGSFSQIITCVNNYSAACNCYKLEDKQKIYNSCNKLYVNCVTTILPKFRSLIMSKVSERQIRFFVDNSNNPISILTHH